MTFPEYAKLYDAHYYAHGCGRPYQRDQEWLNFFDSVAKQIVHRIQPRTALDAGCAMGFLVERLRHHGVEAFGVDISEYAIQQVHPDIQPYCWVGSITDPFPQKYDLIISIEILEHLPPSEADAAIENLCAHSDDILFSSTPIDYKEPTHMNVQPPDYWAEAFARQSFFRDMDFDASFLTYWAVRFRRASMPIPRLVKSYERRMWHLTQENQGRLETNTEQRDQLAQQELALKTKAHEAEIAKQEAEIAKQEAEIAKQTAQLLTRQAKAWQELQTTIGWTVLQSLQHLRARLAPPSSRRERMLVSTFDQIRTLKESGISGLFKKTLRSREAASLYTFDASQNTLRLIDTGITIAPLQVALYTTDTWSSACAVLRLVGPARYPTAGLRVLQGVKWGKPPSLTLPDEADAIVIQRDFPRHLALYQTVTDWARAQSKPIIYELDDLLLELPDGHPEKEYFDTVGDVMHQAITEADAVIVSTISLAEYVRAYNPNTWLLPNYLDDASWALRSKPPSKTSGPIVIGYMGGATQTHLPDLQMVLPALKRLREQYAHKVLLRFWGTFPPELKGTPQVEFIEETFPDYETFGRYFSKQDVDIVIAPLKDNLFNRCKSGIKFLEYSALGVPGIYSRIAPYEGVVVHGKNGFLASSSQEWEMYLRTLIGDRKLRLTLGKAAQSTVQRLLMSDHAHEWGTVYRAALAAATDCVGGSS
jgi:glycosyltransferase involved in cell wall biosynthesis